jgi:crotonobetainyl-CoA:carnitine CoA-transferase CaiB-like acyl-CoA transferase
MVDVPDARGTTRMVATPVDFLGTPSAPRATAPELGQHTDEVRAEVEHRA